MIISKSKKWFIPVLAAVTFMIILLTAQTRLTAAPKLSFGAGDGRPASISINDFHTGFSFNYHFTSGANHSFELGSPTTFNGFVPIDVFTLNIRRDSNVALNPPLYGIFSGNIPTMPHNLLFTQPVTSPFFGQALQWDSLNLLPMFDTLQQGVNAQLIGNSINVYNFGVGGFLPSTSIEWQSY